MAAKVEVALAGGGHFRQRNYPKRHDNAGTTPSIMLFRQPNQLPEQEPSATEDVSLRKRAKYLRKC